MFWSVVSEMERLIMAVELDVDKVATVKNQDAGSEGSNHWGVERMLALETVKLEWYSQRVSS